MQLQLSNEERQMFENLSQSNDGRVLRSYVDRLIRMIESVRTKSDMSMEARIEAANVLDINFIDRFRMLSGEMDGPDPDEHV